MTPGAAIARALALALLLLGAANGARAQTPPPPGEGARQATLKRLLTPDGVLVAQAIAWVLEGVARPDLIAPVRFSGPQALPPLDPGIRDATLRLAGIVVTHYEKPEGAPARRLMRGVVRHEDGYGRFATTAFKAAYRLADQKEIIIDSAAVLRLYSPEAEVRFAVVPGARVSDFLLKRITSSTELLALARENAVRLDRPSEFPKGRKDYYVFAFFLDRLAPGHLVDLRLSDTATGVNGKSRDVHVVDDQGWRVAMIPGRFTLGGAKETFVKAIHLPEGGAGAAAGIAPRLVGIFSTRLPSSAAP
jgi:hypothetical protein